MLAVPTWVQYNPTMFENENVFANFPEESTKDLNHLDAAFTDPFVERVLEMGRTYNKIFQESAPTHEEIIDIVNELDSEWGTLKGSAMQYTGNVKVRDTEDDDETKMVFLDGAEVVSNGFWVEPEYVNDSQVYRVKHHLHVKFIDAYGIEADEAGVNIAGATGDIDSSAVELDIASPERAKAWLTVSCPEMIEEIDLRALNVDGDEDAAILALRDLDFNKYADLSDEFTRNCVNIYLHSIVEVDKVSPYSAKLNGKVRMLDDQSQLYNIDAKASLIFVVGMGMQPIFNLDENDTRWSLSAAITVLEEDRNEDSKQYIIPIETFKTLQSVRSAYYGTNT